MQSMNWLIEQLTKDYPLFHFESADKFLWSADRQTIYIDTELNHGNEFTLHELSHALLNHRGYRTDIELIKLERDAWEFAQIQLGSKYKYPINEDIIQDNLETYREWLHARSKCPECGTTGLQKKSQIYQCLSCGHHWRVNEARLCALRRYSLTTK